MDLWELDNDSESCRTNVRVSSAVLLELRQSHIQKEFHITPLCLPSSISYSKQECTSLPLVYLFQIFLGSPKRFRVKKILQLVRFWIQSFRMTPLLSCVVFEFGATMTAFPHFPGWPTLSCAGIDRGLKRLRGSRLNAPCM